MKVKDLHKWKSNYYIVKEIINNGMVESNNYFTRLSNGRLQLFTLNEKTNT